MRAWLAFWRERSSRERWVIGGGLSVLLLAALYAYLWQPMSEQRQRMRMRLPELRAQAAAMRSQAQEVARLKAMRTVTAIPAGGLQGALETAAQAEGMRDAISQISPQAGNRARVVLAAVNFDQWLKWVAHLQTQSRVHLESCHIEALEQPGMVKIEAEFSA